METPSPQTRLVTGNGAADWIIGFLLTVIAPLFYCFPGIFPILGYFYYRDKFPQMCKGVWWGLIFLGTVLVGGTLALVIRAATKHH